MKKFLLLLFFSVFFTSYAQEKVAFKSGEKLRYKMSYSGFLKAGTMVLSLEEKTYNGKEVLHATGKGWTSSIVGWFFKVDDTYQSYFDKKNVKPYLFKRKINEGGYKKNRQTSFNYKNKTAYTLDFIKQKDTIVPINNVQDLISTFYFLRNHDTKNMKKGDEISVSIFFDDKAFPFKIKLLGTEVLNTKFGKVKTQIFSPLVQAGRVFKTNESVKLWITADKNKVPVKLMASLSVGSLRAELEDYKGLANSFDSISD